MKWIQKALDFFKWRQSMIIDYWTSYWSWLPARIYLLIGAVIALFNVGFALLMIKNLPQTIVILHYNVIFGNDYIGSPWKIAVLPLINLVVLKINIVLAIRYMAGDKLLVHISQVATIVCGVMLILGLYSIYMINFVNIKF